MHPLTAIRTGFLSLLLAIPIAATEGGSAGLVEQARSWFEWGEYGSLLLEIAPQLEDPPGELTSRELAELHLYVGVAQFAAGEVTLARRSFLRALKYDRSVMLDRDYVSQEGYQLFLAAVDEFLQAQAERLARDSLLLQREQQLLRESARIDSLEHQELIDRARASLFLGVGSAAGAALTMGIALAEYYGTAADYHRRYLDASAAGDARERERYASLTRRHDVAANLLGGVSLAGVALSAWFIGRSIQIRRRIDAGTDLSLHGTPDAFTAVVRYEF
jgi:hypothetical protein